ncbi:MAG: hypothetical protein RL223_1721 [Pseudomonadota bacterium]
MAFDAEFDDDALADGPEPADAGGGAPWAVFGDLMTGMLGAFVLLVVWLIASQLDLTSRLQAEQQLRQAEQARRQSLEQALAGPLAGGRVTLRDGRIGINGSVLFASGSHELQPEGRELLRSLAGPLAAYLARREELLMVSGYTDDRLLRQGQSYADNWELSAQRALTVTRTRDRAGAAADRRRRHRRGRGRGKCKCKCKCKCRCRCRCRCGCGHKRVRRRGRRHPAHARRRRPGRAAHRHPERPMSQTPRAADDAPPVADVTDVTDITDLADAAQARPPSAWLDALQAARARRLQAASADDPALLALLGRRWSMAPPAPVSASGTGTGAETEAETGAPPGSAPARPGRGLQALRSLVRQMHDGCSLDVTTADPPQADLPVADGATSASNARSADSARSAPFAGPPAAHLTATAGPSPSVAAGADRGVDDGTDRHRGHQGTGGDMNAAGDAGPADGAGGLIGQAADSARAHDLGRVGDPLGANGAGGAGGVGGGGGVGGPGGLPSGPAPGAPGTIGAASPSGIPAPPHPPARPQLRTATVFARRFDRLRLDQRLDRARAAAPQKAGPLNSHALVLQALQTLQQRAPEHLQHFLAQVDALAALEQLLAEAADGTPATPATRRGARPRR